MVGESCFPFFDNVLACGCLLRHSEGDTNPPPVVSFFFFMLRVFFLELMVGFKFGCFSVVVGEGLCWLEGVGVDCFRELGCRLGW